MEKVQNIPYSSVHLLIADFLLILLFDPEAGGDLFLRNVGGNILNNTVLQHRI
jgi:hypothetical protein